MWCFWKKWLQWTKVWFSGSFIFDIFFQHISIMIGTCFFHFRGGFTKWRQSYAALGRQTSHFDLLGHALPVIRGFHGQIRWTKMWTWDTKIYIYTLYTIYMCKKKQDMILGMSQGLRWFQPFNLEKKKQLYKCKVSRRNASSKHMVSTDLFFLEGSLPPCLFISWKFQPGKYVHRADEWRCCCILQLLEVSRLPFPNRHEFLAVLNCLVFPQKGCLLYTPQWTEQIFVEGFLRCGLKKRPMRQN